MGSCTSSNQQIENTSVVPNAGFVIKSKDESGIKVFINVQHYEHGGHTSDKNILAFVDKNSCHDKKDSEAIYYGVVLSSKSFSAIKIEDIKSVQWIVKEINRNFCVSLDTVAYSIPKIAKGFVGDSLHSVVIKVHHAHSPAEINVGPSAEESKTESNIAAEEREVKSLEPNPIALDSQEASSRNSLDHSGDKGVVHHEEVAPLVAAVVHVAPVPQAHDNAHHSTAPAVHVAATHTTSHTVKVVPTKPQEKVESITTAVEVVSTTQLQQPKAEKVEHVAAAESATSIPLQKSMPTRAEVVDSVAVVEKEIPVMLRGWARKQGHVVRSWKTRYFVLSDGQLAYYADQREAPPFGADLKGRICLAGYRYSLEDGTEVDNGKADGFLGSLVGRRVSVGHAQSSESFKITLHKKDNSFNDYVAKNMVGMTHPDTFIMELESAALKNAWVSAIHSHAYFMEDIISEKIKQ